MGRGEGQEKVIVDEEEGAAKKRKRKNITSINF